MTTGQRPFTGTSWHLINQHLNEQPTPLRTLRPDAPEELERFVSRLLAKDPAQRPSAEEVWDVLDEINDRQRSWRWSGWGGRTAGESEPSLATAAKKRRSRARGYTPRSAGCRGPAWRASSGRRPSRR
ncbi:hypothetical protein [Streptomyces sp. IB2014 016-6]|uniref:hypothetical protein n=1 Tax=Streptomyces sp. IB2014 016-6 TaxID=2517818 RepID=UPI001F4FE1B2|nr:hypothetical protein [Streptomyces sp. IB2014 016-6]